MSVQAVACLSASGIDGGGGPGDADGSAPAVVALDPADLDATGSHRAPGPADAHWNLAGPDVLGAADAEAAARALDDAQEALLPLPLVDPDLPPVALPALCTTAPLVIDLTQAPPPTADRVFERMPLDDLPRDGVLIVLSAGDIDGDGRPDLLIRSPQLRLLINCGAAGFVEAPPLPVPDMGYAVSSHLYDVDDDGLTDLVLGGPAGSVQVLRQSGPRVFEKLPALVTRPDAPNVLVTTLAPVGGLIYVGTLAAAPFPQGKQPKAIKHEHFGAESTWLLAGAEGLQEVSPVAFAADSVACWRAPNFASLSLPRRQWGADDLFFVGNDYGSDCLARIGGGAPLFAPGLELGGLAGDNQTMGADYFFGDEAIYLLTSEFALPPHLWRLGPDASGVDGVAALDDRLEFSELYGYRVSWGIAAEDFDGDLVPDAVIAHGRLVYEEGDLSQSGRDFLESIDVGGAVFLRGDARADGVAMVDESELRLPPLDGGFRAVLVADLFGGDGLGDGCPDVLLAPMMRMPVDDTPPTSFLGESELLLCNHPRRFTGVRIPRSRRATAAVARLELADGSQRLAPIKTSSSLTGSRDAVARFDLGPVGVPDHIDVLLDGGTWVHTAKPVVGRYTQVDAL